MKVEIESENRITKYRDVNTGSTFIWGSEYYIKTDEENGDGDWWACDLSDGMLTGINADSVVELFPLKAVPDR